jgi:hypothetical protein
MSLIGFSKIKDTSSLVLGYLNESGRLLSSCDHFIIIKARGVWEDERTLKPCPPKSRLELIIQLLPPSGSTSA